MEAGCFYNYKTSIKAVYDSLDSLTGKYVCLGGWIRKLRFHSKKEYVFLDVSDGSTVKSIQVVIDENSKNYFQLFSEPIGTGIYLRGLLVKSEGKNQNVEIKISDSFSFFSLFGKCDTTSYKLLKTKDKLNFSQLISIPHLRPRTKQCASIARIRSKLSFEMHKEMQNNGCMMVSTPVITSIKFKGLCSTNDQFQVTTGLKQKYEALIKPVENNDIKEFFGRPTFLASSTMIHLLPYALSLCDVYSFSPCFHIQEDSDELSEFWVLEALMCFSDLHDMITVFERLLKISMSELIDQNKYDIEYFEFNYRKGLRDELKECFSSDIPYVCVTYDKAIELLKSDSKRSNSFKLKVAWGAQISIEHQLYLINTFFNKNPIFITHYPKHLLGEFYKSSSGEYGLFASLILPYVGEIGSCYTIETNHSAYKLVQHDSDFSRLITDCCNYGNCSVSGFSLKFDSIIKYICCCNSIQESIPYPRSRNIIDC